MNEKILEELAELEHNQWMEWVGTMMKTQNITPDVLANWKSYLILYSDLPEDIKEFNRKFARKVMGVLNI